MKKLLTTKGKLNRFFNFGTLPNNSQTTGATTPDNLESDAKNYVTEIARTILPSINYGGTYYISDSMGDDSTAEKGNPNKPYKTFSAVASLYTDEEVIHIIDGNISASGVTSLNDKQYLNIYIESNATLSTFRLRPSVNNYQWSIQGGGNLISPDFLPATTSTDGVLKIEVSYIQSPIIKVTIGKVYVKCNHFNLGAGDQNLQVGNTTDIAYQKLLQIDCKVFE
jgi:hypothetical protein